MLAVFSKLGLTELIVIAVFGIMVFGRNLPRIAVQVAAQLTKMRRSLNKVWRETGVQDEIRRMQREMREVEYEVRDAANRAADAEEAAEGAEGAEGATGEDGESFEGAEHDVPYHEGEVPPDDARGEDPPDSGETTDEPEGEAARQAPEPDLGPDPRPGETG